MTVKEISDSGSDRDSVVVVLVLVTNSNLKNDSGNNSDRSGRQKNILVSGGKNLFLF